MGLSDAQKKERSEYLEEHLDITECSQRKPYVFVSYASENWEMVFKDAVVPLQGRYGLRAYADKAFDKVNDRWIVPMLRNVRGSDMMLAFVSQAYIESYACFLELLTAVNNRKPIVFVSLGDSLHLGDTTDQPNVERGVKNEILNQGGNIATNTNNTSNDIMRAMKSAYTSLSTLLEQDALSKYDISDAFINFFRDASVNRKSVHDLMALRGTIESVSSRVFGPSLTPGANAAAVQEPGPLSGPAPVQEAARPEPGPPSVSAPAQEAVEPGSVPETAVPGAAVPEAARLTASGPAAVHNLDAGAPKRGFGKYVEKLKGNPALYALAAGGLSIVFLSTALFLLSLLASIAGVAFGVKGLKAGRKWMSVIGLVLSGFVLGIFILGIFTAARNT